MAKTPKMTRQKNYCREELAPSKSFDKRSFRTKRLERGRLLVVGCPVGEWRPRLKRCDVGVRAQALLRPIQDAKCARVR